MIKKTVIITGASGGIGKAIAYIFAKNGYNLALIYNNTPISYNQELEENYGIKVNSYKVNLEKTNEIQDTFKKIQTDFEYITTLVNCAGIVQSRKLAFELSTEEINKVLNINLLATIVCCKEITPYFIKNNYGKILNISSFLGEFGCSCESVYAASKSAINSFTKSLAIELGSFNINVNAVAPGFIETRMNNNLNSNEKQYMKENTPIGRLGTPQDIANLVYFLCSEESSFITGQIINCDGGLKI